MKNIFYWIVLLSMMGYIAWNLVQSPEPTNLQCGAVDFEALQAKAVTAHILCSDEMKQQLRRLE